MFFLFHFEKNFFKLVLSNIKINKKNVKNIKNKLTIEYNFDNNVIPKETLKSQVYLISENFFDLTKKYNVNVNKATNAISS